MSDKSFYTKVAGVSKKNANGSSRQKIIEECVWKGHPLDLIPEPNNPYDKNAVGVWWSNDRQIGYLSAEVAEEISGEIAAGTPVSAVVTDVTGGDEDRRTRGVNILIRIGADAEAAIAVSAQKKKSKNKGTLLLVLLVVVACIIISLLIGVLR